MKSLKQNFDHFSVKRGAFFAAASLALSACGTSTSAQTEPVDSDAAAIAAGFDENDRKAVEAIARQYILDNPEIITEAIQILRQRQTAEQLERIRGQIETPYESAWAGNPNGDVTIVEYSDYGCGYCAQSVADVAKILAEDKNLKVVFRELPILSDESGQAAAMSLAAAKQGKFYAFHKAMFAGGKPSAATIAAAARTAGIDMTAANAFISSPEARAQIEQNLQAARQLEFSGTPSWVIGDLTYNGALGVDGLRDAVAKARSANSGK